MASLVILVLLTENNGFSCHAGPSDLDEVCDRSQKTTGFSHRDLHGVCDRRQQPAVASLAENVAVASAGHEVQQLSAFTVPNAERRCSCCSWT